jgi:hypothetical protein
MEPIPSLKQLELLQSYRKVHEDYARICSLCPNLTSLIATQRGRRKSPKKTISQSYLPVKSLPKLGFFEPAFFGIRIDGSNESLENIIRFANERYQYCGRGIESSVFLKENVEIRAFYGCY